MKDLDQEQIAYRVRQALNESVEQLPGDIVVSLRKSRSTALDGFRQRTERQGVSDILTMAAQPLRIAAMTVALSVGVVGTYYWDQFEQASENEEIDSALLSDELPPEIYTDSGFHSWLERSRSSSPL